MSEPNITIIGGGLSAIYSYWGAIDAGYQPLDIEVIYSKLDLPVGAIFMYESPIFWPTTRVMNILQGTCDGYAKNQWGDIRHTSAHTRFNNGTLNPVVDALYMYEEMKTTLWGLIPYKHESPGLSPEFIEVLKKKRKAVIATFANPNVRREYKGSSYVIDIPIHVNKNVTDKHIVIYNGMPLVPWVRQTTIPGSIFTEYSPYDATDRGQQKIMAYEATRGNYDGNIKLVPDLHPDCPPLKWEERIEDNLFRVGRMSCFTPRYLSFEAREETKRFLKSL